MRAFPGRHNTSIVSYRVELLSRLGGSPPSGASGSSQAPAATHPTHNLKGTDHINHRLAFLLCDSVPGK